MYRLENKVTQPQLIHMDENDPFDANASERAYIESVIRAREESLAFFGPGEERQFAREKWCAMTFAADLGSPGTPEEFGKVPGDVTVDVRYRDARFQNKEIMPDGRRRTEESWQAVEKAKNAGRASELLEPFSLEAMTPADIGAQIASKMPGYLRKYPIERDRAKLDLLVYVNFESATLDDPVPDLSELSAAGWRSVSAVTNDGSIVFCAQDTAPEFIRGAVRKGKMKRVIEALPGNTHVRLTFAGNSQTHASRSILSRAVAAVQKTLKKLSLGWNVDWSPEQDAAAEPELVICWGLIDPVAIRAVLPGFRRELERELPKQDLRCIRFGPQMP